MKTTATFMALGSSNRKDVLAKDARASFLFLKQTLLDNYST